MTPTEFEARALVLQQFIALRRSGVNSLDAVNRLVDALPEGPVRERCREAALLLQSPTAPTSPDDFVRVLSSRDDDVKRAAHLVRSFDALLEVDAARTIGRRVLQVAVAAPFVMLAAVGFFSGRGEPLLQLQGLPSVTESLYDLAGVMRIIGLPLAIFAVLLLSRVPVPVFGASSLESARALFTAASLPAPLEAVPGMKKLGGSERSLLLALVRRRAPGEASDVLVGLAARLLEEGRRRVQAYRVLAMLVFAFLAVQGIGTVLIALYLPIFGIAGNIK